MGSFRRLFGNRYPNSNTQNSTQESAPNRPTMSKGRRGRLFRLLRRATMRQNGLSTDTASTPSSTGVSTQASTNAMTTSTPMEATTPEAMNIGTANTDTTALTGSTEFESPLRRKRGSGNYTSSLGIR